jgi:Cu(I)/Ag(I) efflux system protein CusF
MTFFSLVAVVAGAVAEPMVSGEVIKTDKSLARITIKHGPLVNLQMPGMTMPFKVKDPAMLDQVKPGDRVSFSAEKVNGAITITRLEGGTN